jgi:hypothetical protein
MKMKWKVVRRHEGDRIYEEGDIREGTESDLGHLVPKVLELIGPADAEARPKAERAPRNKAERAPANKSEQPARRRRGK